MLLSDVERWLGENRVGLAETSVVRFFRTTTEELHALNNLAEQYLIFAECQVVRSIAMTMQDWITKLDGFLTLNDHEIEPEEIVVGGTVHQVCTSSDCFHGVSKGTSLI